MGSYKIAEKMRYDKEQTQLTKKGCKSNPNNYAEKQYYDINFNKVVLCPFCLNYNELFKFIKNRGFFKCPNCLNDMILITLIKEMSIEEFARWVYGYRLSGFWQKVYPNAKAWFKKLYDLGISKEFWNMYNRLKGESKDRNEFNEDYE
jgi:hypothetical protein